MDDNTLIKILNEISKEEQFQLVKFTKEHPPRAGYLSVPVTVIVEGISPNGDKKVFHLFIKNMTQDEKIKAMMPVVEVFSREDVFYSKVLPAFLKFQEEKALPNPFSSFLKCYKTSIEQNQAFFVFEELTQSGYTMLDKSEPMNMECFELVLKEYGKFHALSLALKEQKPSVFDEITQSLQDDVFQKVMKTAGQMLYANINMVITFLNPREDQKEMEACQKFIQKGIEESFLKAMNYKCEKPVILHGDGWSNNFMFLFEKKEDKSSIIKLKILDWQQSRVQCPVLDLQYFIYTNCSEMVLNNLINYLKIYYDSLSTTLINLGSNPNTLFPFETLQEHWKIHAVFGLIVSVHMIMLSCFHGKEIPQAQEEDFSKEAMAQMMNQLLSTSDGCKAKDRVRLIIKHFVKNGLI